MADNNENIIIQIDANINKFTEKMHQVQERLKSVGQTSEELKKQLSDMPKGSQELGNTVRLLQSRGEALSRYIDRLDIATQNSSKAIRDQVKNLQTQRNEYDLQQRSLERWHAAMEQTEASLGNMLDQYNVQRTAMAETGKSLDDLIRKYTALKKEIGSSEISSRDVLALKRDAQRKQTELNTQQNAIQHAEAQLAVPLGDRIKKAFAGGSSYTEALKKDAENTKKLKEEIAALQKDLPILQSEYQKAEQALKDGKALLKKQQEAEALRREIEALTKTFDEQSAAIDGTERAFSTLGERYRSVSEEANNVANYVSGMQNDMSQGADATAAAAAGDVYAAVAAKVVEVVKKIAEVIKKVLAVAWKAMKPLLEGFLEMSKNALKTVTGFNLLKSASDRLSRAFHQVGRQAARMLTRMAFRAIFQNIGNAMKALALQFESFNAAMSGMGASANQLTGQLVAAFSPLIEAIAPIVNKLISMVLDVANAISMLFAILGGQSTWRRAVKGVYDYSGALDAAGGSAGKAKDETEEYKRTILGFDEINKLNSPTDDKSSSGGGGGSSKNDDLVNTFQYVEEEITHSKLTEWITRLKEAFSDKNWKEVGTIFGEGVNAAFAWVDNLVKWDNAGEKLTQIATDITDVINNFTITVEWDKVGEAIGNFFDSLLKFVREYLSRLNWEEIGNAFAEAINGFFSTFQLSDLTGMIATALNGLGTALGNFADTLNEDEIADNIVNGINEFLDNFKWEENGLNVSNFVNSLLDIIIKVVERTNWDSVGEKIGLMLKSIDWEGIKDKLKTLFKELFKGLSTVIGSVLEESGLGDAIKQALIDMFVNLIGSFVEAFGGPGNSGKTGSGSGSKSGSGSTSGQSKSMQWLSQVTQNYNTRLQKNITLTKQQVKEQNRSQYGFRGLQTEVNGAGATLDKFGNVIQYRVQPLGKTLSDTFTNGMNGANNAITGASPRITSSLSTLANNALNGFKTKFGITGAASRELTSANSTMSGYTTTMEFTGDTLGSKIARAFRNKLALVNPTTTELSTTNSKITGYTTTMEFSSNTLATKTSNAFKNKLAMSGSMNAELDATAKAAANKQSGMETAGQRLGKAFASKFQSSISINGTTIEDGINKSLKNLDFAGQGKAAGKTFADAFEKAAKTVSIEYKLKDTGNTTSHTIMGQTIKQPIMALKAAAQGGLFDAGQFFIAREAGPEMVGTIGNQNAVVNNTQIVDAVSAGVARAVSEVMYQAGNSGSDNRELVINIGPEEVYRAWLNGQKLYNKRTSPTVRFA